MKSNISRRFVAFLVLLALVGVMAIIKNGEIDMSFSTAYLWIYGAFCVANVLEQKANEYDKGYTSKKLMLLGILSIIFFIIQLKYDKIPESISVFISGGYTLFAVPDAINNLIKKNNDKVVGTDI